MGNRRLVFNSFSSPFPDPVQDFPHIVVHKELGTLSIRADMHSLPSNRDEFSLNKD